MRLARHVLCCSGACGLGNSTHHPGASALSTHQRRRHLAGERPIADFTIFYVWKMMSRNRSSASVSTLSVEAIKVCIADSAPRGGGDRFLLRV